MTTEVGYVGRRTAISGAVVLRVERGPAGTKVAELRHRIIRHSPDGFEWGYGGSGPSELALNMMVDAMSDDAGVASDIWQPVIDRSYHAFKFDRIAVLRHDEEWTITRDDVRAWLYDRSAIPEPGVPS